MDDRMTRLSEVARIAVALEQQTGCPAQLMIAQWAVESRWGVAPVGHANYFGIKMAERHKVCCIVSTHEIVNGQRVEQEAQFADYDSLADSCRDYAWLITGARLTAPPGRRTRRAVLSMRWSMVWRRRTPPTRRTRRWSADRRPGKRGAGHCRRAPGGGPCGNGLDWPSFAPCWRR